jgi:hypothetical protein
VTMTARQPRGIPVGGQFAANMRADPSIQLVQLKELEQVFSFSPGTRVMTGNEFGTVSDAGLESNGKVTIDLDAGGSLHLKADRVVPWEAYLDTVMPVPEYNPDPIHRASCAAGCGQAVERRSGQDAQRYGIRLELGLNLLQGHRCG